MLVFGYQDILLDDGTGGPRLYRWWACVDDKGAALSAARERLEDIAAVTHPEELPGPTRFCVVEKGNVPTKILRDLARGAYRTALMRGTPLTDIIFPEQRDAAGRLLVRRDGTWRTALGALDWRGAYCLCVEFDESHAHYYITDQQGVIWAGVCAIDEWPVSQACVSRGSHPSSSPGRCGNTLLSPGEVLADFRYRCEWSEVPWRVFAVLTECAWENGWGISRAPAPL